MKINAVILAVGLVWAASGAARAQEAPPPGEAREALQKACAAELVGPCAGKAGHDAGECLRAAGDKVTSGCRDAMSKMVRPANGARPRPDGVALTPSQSASSADGTWTLEVREDWLVGRLHRALDEHDIDDSEADRVIHEVAGIRERAKQIGQRRGRALTAGETGAQQGRLDALVASIHWRNDSAFHRPW